MLTIDEMERLMRKAGFDEAERANLEAELKSKRVKELEASAKRLEGSIKKARENLKKVEAELNQL